MRFFYETWARLVGVEFTRLFKTYKSVSSNFILKRYRKITIEWFNGCKMLKLNYTLQAKHSSFFPHAHLHMLPNFPTKFHQNPVSNFGSTYKICGQINGHSERFFYALTKLLKRYNSRIHTLKYQKFEHQSLVWQG